jgi:gas vesicle GvpC-like protein
VQQALRRRWAEVVIQGESRGSASEAQRNSFLTYGGKLIERARASHSPVGLVVNWGWDARMFLSATPAERMAQAEAYASQLAADHQTLVAETGARRIDVNAAFRRLKSQKGLPELLLDGNHPTVFGSYVLALAIYREISHEALTVGLWRPAEVSAEAALAAATAVEGVASGAARLRDVSG